jgi:RNA polymerase sporulation-specific sigma factor
MFDYFLLLAISNLIFFALQITGSGSFPPALSAKEEDEYFKKFKDGDEDAKNKLIVHNLRLVAHIVKKYYSFGSDQDDLISIGTIGLIKAVSTFDYTKGTRFATYASRCIENEILMHFRGIKKNGQTVYISDPIDSDGEGNSLSLMDIIYDSASVEDYVEKSALSEKLYKYIDEVLSEREKKIIFLRYGLNGQKAYTQREVADMLNISRSYVSRIEKKALIALNKKFTE